MAPNPNRNLMSANMNNMYFLITLSDDDDDDDEKGNILFIPSIIDNPLID